MSTHLKETQDRVNRMFIGYRANALWASIDEKGEPLDAKHTTADISAIAQQHMRNDCWDFLAKAESLALVDENTNYAKLGNDFWLTRNRHGAGFWDGDWGKELGDKLTKLSHEFKEINLYEGDDGKLYLICLDHQRGR